MTKNLSFNEFKHMFPYIIFGLLLILLGNIYFQKIENEKTNDIISSNHTIFKELEWQLIESILIEEHRAATLQSKAIAIKIETDLKLEYPNLDKLKYEFENPKLYYEPRYLQILKTNIDGVYLYGVKNDNNDPFVANIDGILMDMSINCSSDGIARKWENEVNLHANPNLATDAIRKVLLKTSGYPVWEYQKSKNPNHEMITTGSVEKLKEIFMNEGFEGLKTYEFLAPAYITEKGDIFGTDDINNRGFRERNHKLSVVQGFNLYDQIKEKHLKSIQFYEEREKEITHKVKTDKVIRNIVSVASTITIILIAFFLMVLNNKIFHDKIFYHNPNEEQKEDDGLKK